MTIIKSSTGCAYIKDENGIYEIIDLNDLLIKTFSSFIFIKESIGSYRLKIKDKYYKFHKCPLICKDIYKYFIRKNSKEKVPACYFFNLFRRRTILYWKQRACNK